MLVLSLVIGPPDGRCLVVSLRVRSGLIASHVWPSVRERNSTWAPTYRTPGLSGDSTIGNVHWKRYFRSAAPWPMGLSGQALMLRAWPVRASTRVGGPPWLPATPASGSRARGAIQPLSPPPTGYQSVSSIPPLPLRLAMHTVLLSCCAPHSR